jgi:hypothetical protein
MAPVGSQAWEQMRWPQAGDLCAPFQCWQVQLWPGCAGLGKVKEGSLGVKLQAKGAERSLHNQQAKRGTEAWCRAPWVMGWGLESWKCLADAKSHMVPGTQARASVDNTWAHRGGSGGGLRGHKAVPHPTSF